MATNVDDLLNLDEEDYVMDLPNLEQITDKDDLNKIMIDFSYPEDYRIRALEIYNEKFEQDIAEIVNKITGMYIFSRAKTLEEYIYSLCVNSTLPPNIKVILVKGLCSHGEKIGYKALDVVCSNLKDVPSPVQVETIKTLFNNNEYRDNGLKYFIQLVNNQNIECDFRYKTILNLEHDNEDTESLISSPEDSEDERENERITQENERIKEKNLYIEHVIKKSMLAFFFMDQNNIMYRLLAGQYLLQKYSSSIEYKEDIETAIIDIAEDSTIEYNLRADAADIILQLGDDKQRAQRIILLLGNVEGKARTLFENAQNAHYDEFTVSVNEGIDFLNTIPLLKINDIPITFDYIKKQIQELIKQKYTSKPSKHDKIIIEKIHIALNRINMDRALYSKYNCTLIGILLKVWTYIANHKDGDAMKQRMLEELNDMAGICSTGFAERLINVISGFGDFNFRISFEDQIVANFSGRLNARAKNIVKNWNTPRRLIIVANDLIKLDHVLRKKVLRRFLQDNNLLAKYEHVIRGPYRKNINVFEDEIEYNRLIAKLSNDGNAPSDQQRYDTYVKIIEEDCMTDDSNKEILEEFQGNVIVELSIDTIDASNRLCFSTFLREEMLSIREELYKEFKEHISDQDFDNFFRTAISKYESA